MPPKSSGIIRLGLRNLNSMPLRKSHSKNEQILRDIVEGEFDIMCNTEINVAWHNVTGEDTVQERFSGRMEIGKFVTSNNRDKEYKEKFQREGTMITCTGSVCTRVITS
jgi:hypothetical protein